VSIAMGESLAGIVLAAGTGTRLRPLTDERPKALCPVGNELLIDRTLAGLGNLGLRGRDEVAVNAHHLAGQMAAHLDGDVHVSVEEQLLGTGGAVGRLRAWVDGRSVVLVNADAWHEAPLAPTVEAWDGARIRFVVAGDAERPLDRSTRLCAVLMPWAAVRELPDAPVSIYDAVWRRWEARSDVEAVGVETPFFDCGTAARYLAANLWSSGGLPVVASDANVHGTVERTVVWSGAEVRAGEHLVDAVRTTRGRTVLVRRL
jgi:NDP-sugar pyrophosphorylase family protein